MRAVPRIRNLYWGTLDAIMREHNIRRLPRGRRADPVVRPNANFTQVVRHTSYYWRDGDNQPHYRYDRYRAEALKYLQPSDNRQAHVDIGCGAGLFSLVFLDWARDANIEYDRVDLYGLDHSRQMIRLAYRVRDGLVKSVADYPDLHYTNEVGALLQELTGCHRAGTDYTITFGHVLIQANTPNAIRSFTRVIVHILGLQDNQSRCNLIAVDARRQPVAFASAWNALLSRLEQAGVTHQPIRVPRSARAAQLFIAR